MAILETLTANALRRTDQLIILPLIGESSHHHVCGLLVRICLLHQPMGHISIHHYIIFFYYCDPIHVLIELVRLLHVLELTILLPIMELLRLYYVASLHLWILYFNLRIVEYEIVIINIFYYFYWLVLAFLFWFWWATTSSMRTIYSNIHVLIREPYIHSILIHHILLIHEIFKILAIILLVILLCLMSIVSRKLIISENSISSLKCFIFSFLSTKLFFFN